MHILKVSLAIVALAAPLATARAQEATAAVAPAPETVAVAPGGGWTDTWALLFQLNNIFQVQEILSSYQGGIGGQYYLAPDMAVRTSLNFQRSKSPVAIIETVDETAGTRDVSYSLATTDPADTWTSETDVRISADFLYRLSDRGIAPYAGAGLSVSSYRDGLSFVDDSTTVNQITTYKGHNRTTTLSLHGLVGAEWRLHQTFALTAEYGVWASVLGQTSRLNDTVTEVTIDGERTVRHQSSTSSVKTAPQFGTTLSQGASLGLVVNF